MQTIILLAQIVITLLALGSVLYYGHQRLRAYFESRPHLTFRYQLLQVAGILVSILLVILLLPFGDTMRGQLLRLYGLIFSATIALSSTTLVGNVMAGIMLRAIGSCRPGNYVTVGDYFGRISEMDLLHTEIQTEERDLTTLPNLYLVTHPVRVMRTSGTLLSVEVSLGYDVPRSVVEKVLIKAATDAGLESPYVQIRNLGDFSVTYQVSALLKEVNKLIGKRRELRSRTMDGLHGEGIEIVSPSFMNTRSISKGETFMADVTEDAASVTETYSPDSIIFDKAEKAASLAKIRATLAETEARIRTCDELISDPSSEQALEAAQVEKQQLIDRAERLASLIARKEEKISKDKS